MKWSLSEPHAGDMIRVFTGAIYHYGIFVSDGEIIQFGLPPQARPSVSDCDVEVCSSDITTFLNGGFLEVAIPEKKEAKKRLNPTKTVDIARSMLGSKGYDALNNNCEHFAYECFLGERVCTQTESLKAFLKGLPSVDVFLTEIPNGGDIPHVHCRARRADIKSCTNERVKREKAFAWALLERAAEQTFDAKAKKLKFAKLANGKWTCPDFFFSITHTKGAVAVAISKSPIGIDIEWPNAVKPQLAERVLSALEFAEYDGLSDSEKPIYLTKTWTLKESIFKKEGGEAFAPQRIEAAEHKGITKTVLLGDSAIILSVATDTPEITKIHTRATT